MTQMANINPEVTITEDFDDSLGRFVNYDTYDPDLRTALLNRQHRDIRSFIQNDQYVARNMFRLDGYNMGVGFYRNFVTNPSFEVNTTGWTTTDAFFLNPNATLLRTLVAPVVGIGAGQVSTTGASSNQGIITPLGVLPAGTYNYSAYIRGGSGGEPISMRAGHADGTHTSVNPVLTTTMQRFSSTFVSDGVNPAYLVLRVNTATAVLFFIDGLMVVAGSTTPPYFDGSIPPGAWDGTAHASASVSLTTAMDAFLMSSLNGTTVLTNLVTNPSFEGAGEAFTFTSGTRLNDPTKSLSGNFSIALTSSDSASRDFTGLIPGVTYRISVGVRRSTGATTRATLFVTNSLAGAVNPPSVLSGAGTGLPESRLTYLFTATANGIARIFLVGDRLTDPTFTGTAYFDQLMMVQTSADVAYFDGTTIGGAWTGAANASTSTKTVATYLALFRPGEAWTGGTVASYAPLKNRPVLSMTLANGVTTTASSIFEKVDLTTGFTYTDHISVALPTFPAQASQLNSFLDFTSEPSGSFATNTVSLRFSDSVVALGSGVDSELRFLLNSLVAPGFDPKIVTGVRFRILGTGVGTVRVAAIRTLKADYVAPTADLDTLRERLTPSVSRTGGLTGLASVPIAYRSYNPPGQEDPRPIDSNLAVSFNSGGVTQGDNVITVFLRERAEDYLTQLDITNVFLQSELDALGKQPDFGRAMYATRPQKSVDSFKQSDLDLQNQFDLERQPDFISQAYISVAITWNGTSTFLQISDAEAAGYGFLVPLILSPNTDYLLSVDLRGNVMRAKLYPVGADREIVYSDLIFDTQDIRDDFLFKRRKGRVGWSFVLSDGDAYVDSIRTSYLNFAEYQSHIFNSITPVKGIELFVSATPDQQLVQGVQSGPFGGQVDTDKSFFNKLSQSSSSALDESLRITNTGDLSFQGIQTTEMLIDDWTQTSVNLDVWFPQNAIDLNANLVMFFLSDRGRVVLMPLPIIAGDQWQTINLTSVSTRLEQTGLYKLCILQPISGVPTTWWIDNFRVNKRSFLWSGRALADGGWFPFTDVYNQAGNGITLPDQGFEAQVRGQSMRQGGYIERISFKPKYAELGNFVWTD